MEYKVTTQDYLNNWERARSQALHEGLQIIEIGWEQHVIIDLQNNIVYRYPRHAAAAAKLADEVDVLKAVNAHKWLIKLPVMLEHSIEYTSYVYVPGDVLDQPTLQALTNYEIQKIGTALGSFLVQFHGLEASIVEQKKTKQSTSLLEYYSKRIDSAASTEFYEPAKLSLDHIKKVYNRNAKAVVHGDLHGLNILIDADTKQLSGVIDLSEMEIGDPHQDFRKLFMTDPRLMEPAIESYISSGGTPIDAVTVKSWAYVNEWANVCHFASRPKNATYQRALQHLQSWQKI